MTLENVQKIDSALGHFGDWFRFSGGAWLIWSDVNEQVLYGCLKSQLAIGDSFLVVRFDSNSYAGWGPGEIDQWVNARKLKLIS
jgi:hypothetical protein